LRFVCMLKPKSFIIEKQDLEIEVAQWMPLEEYDNPPSAKESICIPRLLTDSLQK
nr:NUDIX hydrolase 2-like [Tanacetum cinerariifolium]